MRVIIVSDSLAVQGGASKVAVMSAVALANAGHDVHLIGASGEASSLLQNSKVQTHGLGLTPLGDMPIKQRIGQSLWRLESEVIGDVIRPLIQPNTVVHIHCYRDSLSASGMDAILKLDVPTVFTAHDYRLGCPVGDFYDSKHGHICHLTGNSVQCWLRSCHEGGYGDKLFSNVRYRVARTRAGVPDKLKNVAFVSNFARKVLTPYLSKDCRTTVIGNPIEFTDPGQAKLEADGYLLFVGKLQGGKDPVMAARIAAKVGVPIVFVGDGPLSDEVLKIVPDAKITGWIPPEKVAEYFKKARAFLFPARWYEGQPLSVLESIANGVPVLCRAECAASEIVERYQGGLVVTNGTEESLSEATTRLLSDEGRQIGARGYWEFWTSPPDLACHARQTLAFYEEVLAA